MKRQLLSRILKTDMKTEVIESKQLRQNPGASGQEKGAPPIPVSPIMLMKTNGVKMSISGLAIMLMKTQPHRGGLPLC
jgi:hypothetical protein